MSSSITHPQTIVPWETALLEELEDKPSDKIEAEEWRKAEEAKRICREQEAEAKRIRELEAKHKQLEEEMRRAQQAGGSSSQQVPPSTGKAVDRPNGCMRTRQATWLDRQGITDDGDDEAMEDTPDVKMKDSVAEVLNRRLGEVVKLLQKNNTAIVTLARDVQDLSGVLEESFKALKTATMALVSWAQNADNV
ncbi:hypothetical protein PISMIDRAFT_16844 [Pisolithus microcarpus 441]|uniref:Uncharacterized protein n=1 Tax=Pisolithus microcarpus 441 TaxID=765257 RepID=A0A0C9XRW5_9AGAM|nr:hypothetical protein PISMIDRAFT_16844 [Pisolithus microcarpus 441]